MAKIFISYRRDDSGGLVGRLYDHLLQHFDEREVFRDIDTIRPGQDFVMTIEKMIEACDALIVVIGPQWVDIRDPNGRRRLDHPEDFVRLEISNALKRNKLVLPVLVDRARMPDKHELPASLSDLARRNAVELSHDRFAYDVDRIVQAIGGAYGKVVVSVGASWFSSSPQNFRFGPEFIHVYSGRRLVGTLKLPKYISNKSDFPKPLKIQVEEGTHVFYGEHKRVFYEPGIKSNEISCKIKGGQTQTLTIERHIFPSGKYRVVIKPY